MSLPTSARRIAPRSISIATAWHAPSDAFPTRIFGMDEQPGLALAHHLGRALQLTNILRDLDEDAAIGRLYLPRELLAKAGIASYRPVGRDRRRAQSTAPAARWPRRRSIISPQPTG